MSSFIFKIKVLQKNYLHYILTNKMLKVSKKTVFTFEVLNKILKNLQ